MKTSILTILFLTLMTFAFSQNDYNPPARVRESFQKVYPQSHPSHWSHSSGSWSVVFEDKDHDNGEVTAHFDSRGRHMDTHILYDNNDVPPPVTENLRHRYNGSDNYEFTRIERPGKEGIYRAHFRHQKRYQTRYLDENGHEKEYYDRH